MADYYPLLSRAVGALSDSSADARRSIYDRARKALVGQLQAIQPPIAEADIARETDALDEAVARIEAEIAGKAAAETAKPPAGDKPPAPEKAPEAPPKTEPPKTEPPKTELLKTGPLKTEPPKAASPKPPAEQAEEPASEAAKAPAKPDAPQTGAVAPAAPKPGMPPLSPKAPEPPSAAPIPPSPPKPFSFRPPEAVEAEKAARKAEDDTAGSVGTGENAELEAGGDAAATALADNELETPPSLKAPRPREAPRPAAPGPAAQASRGNRLWIVGGVVVGVVLLIAGLAIKLKGRPEDLAKLRPAPTAPAEAPSSGKIAGRVGDETPAATTEKTETKQPATPAANQAPLPVAHRAALLVEAPETPEKVKTYIGSVVWRLDNVPGGPGQPLGTAVHADVEIPEAKVRMTVDLQKNMDASLNASHTIEIRFSLQQGSIIPGVKQIGAVQMRREDMANGDPLAGVPVPITDTYYLVGLARGDMEARNIELLKTRGWLDVPLALTNGRIAKFSLEKGASGDRVINDALSVWAQQK
ncbi:MAG: hypothetical protein KF904_11140 [Rhodoblastus sp.]|nr:hypothetical protein [Rhodoblastus sp.]